jgi:Cu(I)/Ag(I) efflux system membrane fusion protein
MNAHNNQPPVDDEGGLHAPPELTGWRKAWWWFDFLILVKIARLRFIVILALIGVVITQWDWLLANYDKWTRPDASSTAASGDFEFFCPMHPTIVRSEPGQKCPICFMPLSKRKRGPSTNEPLPAGVVSRVQLSPYRIVLAGVQTVGVDFQPLTKEVTAVGTIEFNERGQRTIAARVKGRIEKLLVNVTGQMVAANDVLAELYSPELDVTVRNLLDAQRQNNQELLAAARVRLERWGIDDAQLNDILKRGRADATLKIRSPVSGHVITKYVREGQYIEEGMPLYDLADLSTVWVQAQVYEEDLPFLPTLHGSPIELDDALEVSATTRAFPNETFRGRLSFIYPHVDERTRTVAVRFELPNPEFKLRPGSTARVTLQVKPQNLRAFARLAEEASRAELTQGRLLAAPEGAVIDTGNQQIVYRERSPGVYEGVAVKLGPRMTGLDHVVYYPLLKGLNRGDRIVASGSFLVDAETRLNPAAGSIYVAGASGSGQRPDSTVRPSTPEPPADDEDAAPNEEADGDQIRESFAKLAPDDRTLAERQKFCVVLPKSRLGAMGPPVKLLIKGQPVFLCCEGCRAKALADPDATLKKATALRERSQKREAP